MNIRRLLLVDDNPEFSDMLKRRLNLDAPHFKVYAVGGGEECLRNLKERNFDCILSDFQMPGMDGLKLLKKIRAAGNDIPFILLTGQGNEDVAREAFKSGAYDYFTKEVGFAHYARIVNSIEQAVNKRLTERLVRKAELALLDEKNKLNDVLSCIGDAISIQGLDLRVQYQNLAHKALVGDHAGEFCYSAYEGRDAVCDGCPVTLALADGDIHTAGRSRSMDGSTLNVEITASPLRDSTGVIVGGIESVRDITARKKAEQEKERLLKGVSAIREGIAFTDKDDKFVYVNGAHAAIYGYSPAELSGRSWRDITPPENIPAAERFVENTLHDRDVGEFTAEFPGFRKDGSTVMTEVHATSIWDERGAYQGHLCIVMDITERKRLDRERTDFHAMVSHDIKSPLSSIIGYTELLSMPENSFGDNDSREMVEGIQRSARRVVGLLEDFMTISRMESGRMTPNSSLNKVPELLHELREEFEPVMSRRQLGFSFECPGELPAAYFDRRLIVRAVSNLLGNAAKYTPTGGAVRLAADTCKEDGRKMFTISVTDSGPGIPFEEQGRVFEMYYRAKGSDGTKGTGLGLAIVKAAAVAHGGRVELTSEPGEGCCFQMVIPVFPGQGSA